jgi:hypothetical protein
MCTTNRNFRPDLRSNENCVFTIYDTTHFNFPHTMSERKHKLRRIATQKRGKRDFSAHSLSI